MKLENVVGLVGGISALAGCFLPLVSNENGTFMVAQAGGLSFLLYVLAALGILASLAGFTPRITHQIDSLDLVELLILSGYGVGLMPLERKTREGVRVEPLVDPPVILTAYAVTRRGRSSWPPLRLVLDRLTAYR